MDKIHCKVRVGNDIHKELIALLKKLQEGWIPPSSISEDEYNSVRLNKENYPDYYVGLFGQKESKTANEEYEKARKSYIEANTMELIDPVNILEKIEALEVEIADFTTEVDSALSVSNALTEITVEY